MSARFLLSTFLVVRCARSGLAREHHLERDEEKQQAAKDPERVDCDAHRGEKAGTNYREKQQYSACN